MLVSLTRYCVRPTQRYRVNMYSKHVVGDHMDFSMVNLELGDGTSQNTPRDEVVLLLEIGAKALHIPTQAVVTIMSCKDSKVDVQDAAGKVYTNQPYSAMGYCIGAKCLWSNQFSENHAATLAKAKVIRINQCTRKTSWTFDIILLDGTVVRKVSRCALTMFGNAHVMYYPARTGTAAIIAPGVMAAVTGVQYNSDQGYLFDLRFPDKRFPDKTVPGICLALSAATTAFGRVPV